VVFCGLVGGIWCGIERGGLGLESERMSGRRGGETNGGTALKVGGRSAGQMGVFEGSTLPSREDPARADARFDLGEVGKKGEVVGGGVGRGRVGRCRGRILAVGAAVGETEEGGGRVLPWVGGEYLGWGLHGEAKTEEGDSTLYRRVSSFLGTTVCMFN